MQDGYDEAKIVKAIRFCWQGQKQLVEVKSSGVGLAETMKKVGKEAFLMEDGLPPLPGRGRKWTQRTGEDAAYPDKWVPSLA